MFWKYFLGMVGWQPRHDQAPESDSPLNYNLLFYISVYMWNKQERYKMLIWDFKTFWQADFSSTLDRQSHTRCPICANIG